MSLIKEFSYVIPNLTKYETNIEKYIVPDKKIEIIKDKNTEVTVVEKQSQELCIEEKQSYLAFQEPLFDRPEPKVSLWDYMTENELENFLILTSKSQIRSKIGEKLTSNYPKGIPRELFIDLMYNVTKFCKTNNYNIIKSGAALSIFYLTHQYFVSQQELSAEKIYIYYKELIITHTLPYPPEKIKVFTQQEAKDLVIFFYKLYLRNLPLIQFLCLPNFAFNFNYEVEPEPPILKKKRAGKPEKKSKKKH